MKLHKRLLNSSVAQAIISYCLYRYMQFVYATTRWEIIGKESLDNALAAEKPVILTAWHGRLFILPKAWQQKKPPFRVPTVHAVISLHNDGEVIARIIAHFGHQLVRGSSFRGAFGAIKECLRILKQGECLGITPDGPRGPRMRVGGNIMELARIGGAVIVPCTFSIANALILKSWDRFMFPLPFQHGVLLYGAPISLGRQASPAEVEEQKLFLEQEMNRITQDADFRVGTKPVLPEDNTL